ncbi:MAG: hypothetical protein H7831_14340 [Magnetococcus sp. WYHC-3]
MAAKAHCLALGLHLHQPPGNLHLLATVRPDEAETILLCYDRLARHASKYPRHARFSVSVSGSLLEQLQDPELIALMAPRLDLGSLLQRLRQLDNIEWLGTAQTHAFMPWSPRRDWAEQLSRGRAVVAAVLGQAPRGFWPPGLGLIPEMIPALAAAGYDYAVADLSRLPPPADAPWDPHAPVRVEYQGARIILVPRDAELSRLQEGGLDHVWLANEGRARMSHPRDGGPPRLATTWSDGENSPWMRERDESAGFFGRFFTPMVEHWISGEYPLEPAGLADFLARHPPERTVSLTSETAFPAPPAELLPACATLEELSRQWWQLAQRRASLGLPASAALAAAHQAVLATQRSDLLQSGEFAESRLREATVAALAALARAEPRWGTQEPAANNPATDEAPTLATASTDAPPPPEVVAEAVATVAVAPPGAAEATAADTASRPGKSRHKGVKKSAKSVDNATKSRGRKSPR